MPASNQGTYVFVGCLGIVLILGLVRIWQGGGQPLPVVPPPPLPEATAGVSLWLLLRAFASGCTAMTGVEAVSNGVSAFRPPTVRNATATLTIIVALLASLLAGIAYVASAYGVGATEPGQAGYESVLSALTAAVVGRGPFYYLTIGAILLVLGFSANTGFAALPRVCSILARDDYLPHAFAQRGRRLVYSLGIFALTALAALLLIAFGGVTDRLIPLFAVGAFLAFTLSQAGMVRYWQRVGGPGAGPKLADQRRRGGGDRRRHGHRPRRQVRRGRLGHAPARRRRCCSSSYGCAAIIARWRARRPARRRSI